MNSKGGVSDRVRTLFFSSINPYLLVSKEPLTSLPAVAGDADLDVPIGALLHLVSEPLTTFEPASRPASENGASALWRLAPD